MLLSPPGAAIVSPASSAGNALDAGATTTGTGAGCRSARTAAAPMATTAASETASRRRIGSRVVEEMAKEQLLHVGREHPVGDEALLARDQHRASLEALGEPPVRALHEGRIERDDVHQVAKPEHLLRETKADLERDERDLRIDEELDGVVPRLAMDVDGARVVRRERVVVPEVVREPAVRARDRHELARAPVVEARLALAVLVEDALHAVE